MKKSLIIALVVLIIIGSVWYASTKISWWSPTWTKILRTGRDQTVATLTGTGTLERTTESQSWTVDTQKNSRNMSREDMETIQRHMEIFMQELHTGSLDKALFLYKKIIDLSHDNPLLTGGDIGDKELADKLASAESELKNTQDPAVMSKLFLEKGIAEYGIGNMLYYSDARKYQFAVLYYWLRATDSFDRSNEFGNNALAHRYKWVTIMDIGSPTRFAIEELNKAIALDSRDTISYYKLGNAYRQTEEYDLAIASYLKGIGVDNAHELMRLNLWVTYFDKGDREKGYETYRSLLDVCKDYCHVVNFNMANELETDHKFKDAMEFRDRAIAWAKLKMVVYRNAYREKGQALYLSNNTEALQNLKMSLNDPNDPARYDNNFNQNDNEKDTYLYIGKTYIALQDYNNARAYLEKANMLFPWDEELMKLYDSIKSR